MALGMANGQRRTLIFAQLEQPCADPVAPGGANHGWVEAGVFDERGAEGQRVASHGRVHEPASNVPDRLFIDHPIEQSTGKDMFPVITDSEYH